MAEGYVDETGRIRWAEEPVVELTLAEPERDGGGGDDDEDGEDEEDDSEAFYRIAVASSRASDTGRGEIGGRRPLWARRLQIGRLPGP